jgi:nucleotide-binding universal stress UspA family protein
MSATVTPDVRAQHLEPSGNQYNILYPVDFSRRSILAIEHVKYWVEHFRAALDTLHVVNSNAYRSLSSLSNPSLYQEQSRIVARRTDDLKQFSDQYFGKDIARSFVLYGDRADLIEHFAEREQIDLIMLPHNHQGLIARIFYDSLTAKLLERCRASVWMTEHLEDATPSAPSVPSKVLCAVQFGHNVTTDAQSHRILETVQQVISSFQADVKFLDVSSNKTASEHSTELRIKAGSMLWLEQARRLFGSSVKLLRASGSVIAAIGDTASNIGADLVVVGRMNPNELSLGQQSRILNIDQTLQSPVLSVW